MSDNELEKAKQLIAELQSKFDLLKAHAKMQADEIARLNVKLLGDSGGVVVRGELWIDGERVY